MWGMVIVVVMLILVAISDRMDRYEEKREYEETGGWSERTKERIRGKRR